MPRKYGYLLEDPDVKRWYKNLRARSMSTAEVYLRTLGYYCKLNNTTHKEILKVADSKEFRDKFIDFVRMLEDEGKAGSYISRYKDTLHSWLSFNGLDVKLKVNIANENDAPRIADERVPNKDELDKILRMATPRARVAIALMAFSGLRPQTIGNYDGSDGLRIKDFPEAEIKGNRLEFSKVPSRLIVRKNLSKARHKYFTFIPEQTITYINEYLEQIDKEITKDSPLLGLDSRGFKKNTFMRTNLVTRDIREAIKRAGFNFRPYVLRAYCDTNMIIAESKGKMSHPYLQFMMGHKGDIEARYSTNKGILPPDMIEDMRECYKGSLPYLLHKIEEGERSSILKESKLEAIKMLAEALGVKILDIKIAKERELDRELEIDEELELFENELKRLREGNHNPQKIVREDELERYIEDGWEFVSILPSQKILIKR